MHPKPEEAAEILDQAADYIERKGWTRGAMERNDGTVCATGAIKRVVGRRAYQRRDPIVAMTLNYLAAMPPVKEFDARRPNAGKWHLSPETAIQLWNDGDANNQQQVLDTIRKASKRALGVE